MRKIVIILTILLTFQFSTAQEQSSLPPRDTNKNEIGLNPVYLVAFGALDIAYERVISSNSTIGVDFFYKVANSDKNDEDNDFEIIDTEGIFDKEIAFTTRFKYFFGDRIARGFYMEAFGMLSSGEHDNEVEILDDLGNFLRYDDVEKEYTDFALGFGVGGKFVSQKGFFIDIGFGIGRNLFNEDSPEITLRPNLYLGYRF